VVQHPGGPLRIAIEGGSLRNPYLAMYADSYDPDDICTNLLGAGTMIAAPAFPAGAYAVVVVSAVGGGLGTYTLTIE
jgi:hypothetical protein